VPRKVSLDAWVSIPAIFRPFQPGHRIPVNPPGTVAIVRGSGTVKAEGGEMVLEYLVDLEWPGNGVGQS
jgi:hypothetical protein